MTWLLMKKLKTLKDKIKMLNYSMSLIEKKINLCLKQNLLD